MDGLKLEFKILSFCGIWMPLSWRKNKAFRFLYNVYSFCSAGTMFALASLHFVSIILTAKIELQYVTDVLFVSVRALTVIVKAVVILLRKNEVIDLMESFNVKLCQPSDLEELRMQKKSHNFIRKFTLTFNAIGQVTTFMFFMVPLAEEEMTRKLPLEIWLPFDLHKGSNYRNAYLLQIIPFAVGIFISSTVPCIIIGLEVYACTQFDYIRHRIQRLCNDVEKHFDRESSNREELDIHEQEILAQCVNHHINILKFPRRLCKVFESVLLLIYFASVLTISATVYQISTQNSSTIDKVRSLIYLTTVTAEILVYCWFGNELKIKSSNLGNDIYNEINWIKLSKKSIKTLMFITLRALYPVEISFSGIINFNLDSFKSIMKVAYSTFNILKRSN